MPIDTNNLPLVGGIPTPDKYDNIKQTTTQIDKHLESQSNQRAMKGYSKITSKKPVKKHPLHHKRVKSWLQQANHLDNSGFYLGCDTNGSSKESLKMSPTVMAVQ